MNYQAMKSHGGSFTMYILQEQKFLLPGIFHSREAGEGGRAQQLYSIYIQVVVVYLLLPPVRTQSIGRERCCVGQEGEAMTAIR